MITSQKNGKRELKMSKYSNDDIEQRIKNKNKLTEKLDGSNDNDYSSFYAGLEEKAKAQELERFKKSLDRQDELVAQMQKQHDEVQGLLDKLSEKLATENQSKANQEIQEAKAKAENELNQAISKKYGVKSDEEVQTDNAYKEMLKGLIKD